MVHLLGESALATSLASESVLTLSERISVALSCSTIPWLDSAEGSVWVVRRLEGSLSRLGAALGAVDIGLFVGELLSISAHNDARIEGEQEEDEETKDQPSIIRSEDALAAIPNLIGCLSSLIGIVNRSVYSLSDSRDGSVGLLDAFGDEVVLE